ncbi:unnamed protein product [Cunninghamella echinulata]
MWEPNEQLLLRAPVRYKNCDGSLFVTPRRVAWQQHGIPQLNPSISYEFISGLAQTPESSAKVILKITINETETESKDYKFLFTSMKALTEREGIKAQITELWAKSKGMTASNMGTPTPFTPSSPAQINRSPASTPKHIPSSTPIATPSTPQQAQSKSSKPPLQPPPSTPATPSTSAKTKGSSPGASSPSMGSASNSSANNSLQQWRQQEFNARRQLLSKNRELQKLHMELVVGGKIVSEEEFWASPYIKRFRQKLKMDAVSKEGRTKGKSSKMVELKPGQQEGSDVKYTLTSQTIHNIFTEYPSVKRAYDTNVPDILSEQDFWKRFLASEFFHRSRTGGRSQLAPYDDIFDRCLQEEDEENAKAPDMSQMDRIQRIIDLEASIEDHVESGNAPDFTMKPGRDEQVLPLIRRFNRHASRVLEIQPSKNKSNESNFDISKEIILDDLTNDPPPEKVILDIQDTSRYFETQNETQDISKINKMDAEKIVSGFKKHFKGWQPELTKHVMDPKIGDKVCMDLTERIRKRKEYDGKSNSDQKLPPTALQVIQNFHSATNEILRHFWSSNDPYRPDKNTRMIEGLKRQQKKVNSVLDDISKSNGDIDRGKEVLEPLLSAMKSAFEVANKRRKTK